MNAPLLSETDEWVIALNAKGDNSPGSLRMNAILIRTYGDAARTVILAYRKEYQERRNANMQKWQHSISRRPQRGRFHDSWGIREGSIRDNSGYGPYYGMGHELIRNAIRKGAKHHFDDFSVRTYIRL